MYLYFLSDLFPSSTLYIFFRILLFFLLYFWKVVSKYCVHSFYIRRLSAYTHVFILHFQSPTRVLEKRKRWQQYFYTAKFSLGINRRRSETDFFSSIFSYAFYDNHELILVSPQYYTHTHTHTPQSLTTSARTIKRLREKKKGTCTDFVQHFRM